MPARDDEVQGCEEEGVNLRFLLAPKKIELNESGSSRLRITYAKMELGEPDASGRRRPVEIPGSEFTEDVDLVIAAIGQYPKKYEGFGVQTDDKGRITVRADSMLTSKPKRLRRRRLRARPVDPDRIRRPGPHRRRRHG
jgi:NADPH-dependent glutamate synthase beta subunit-like oxidoreductase